MGLVLFGTAVATAPANQLWNQDPSESGCGGGVSSQDARNPGGLGWFSETADNFPGQAGWTIHVVEFNGGYTLPPGHVGHTHGFTIRFYTDNAGRPGTRVFEQDVMSFTEVQYCVEGSSGYAGYRYQVTLAPDFSIATTGQYWVSIVAILDRGGGANEPAWRWTVAASLNPPAAMNWFFDPGNFNSLGFDVAFTLVGTAGPARRPGDLNCDGVVNFADIDPFVLALSDPAGYQAAFPNCDIMNGDVNNDGTVNFADIDPFVALFGR